MSIEAESLRRQIWALEKRVKALEDAAKSDAFEHFDNWNQILRGTYPIAQCRRCGFECWVGADATIEEHDKSHEGRGTP